MKRVREFCRESRLKMWQAQALLFAGVMLAIFFIGGGVYLISKGDIGGISYIGIGPFLLLFAALGVAPAKVESWLARI